MSDFSFPNTFLTALRSAQSLTVLTGAGISAASGLPTFRDAQTGLWAQYRPEDLATPEAFERAPRLVWEWYAWRREMLTQVHPNAAHFALAEMQRFVSHFTLITQNVDGLHQQAGSTGVLELHGSLARTKCSVEHTVIEHWENHGNVPPLCPHCGSLLRPDVVWFGENLPFETLQSATKAAESCDIFLTIGTSGQVEPAASLMSRAARQGAVTAIFNTQPAQNADYQMIGFADQTLPALVQTAWPQV
jgi:NAD-dependent deacetylase